MPTMRAPSAHRRRHPGHARRVEAQFYEALQQADLDA
jgi:hypothetical protein